MRVCRCKYVMMKYTQASFGGPLEEMKNCVVGTYLLG